MQEFKFLAQFVSEIKRGPKFWGLKTPFGPIEWVGKWVFWIPHVYFRFVFAVTIAPNCQFLFENCRLLCTQFRRQRQTQAARQDDGGKSNFMGHGLHESVIVLDIA